ncbi:hypothetical protein C8J57DRAFT_1464264 [Mycena rebaudengoi]|nr:hypothetical protein C8J57DRAFT_1464264 [Mycena rebaudengoi]
MHHEPNFRYLFIISVMVLKDLSFSVGPLRTAVDQLSSLTGVRGFRLGVRTDMIEAFPGFNVVPQNFRRAAFQNYCSSHPKSINDARQVFFGGNRRAQLPYINMGLHTDLHYTVATLPQNRCIDVLDDGAVQRERPQQVRTSIERRGKDLVYRALG